MRTYNDSSRSGILDRIDSGLLGIPVMYYGFLFFVFLQAA